MPNRLAYLLVSLFLAQTGVASADDFDQTAQTIQELALNCDGIGETGQSVKCEDLYGKPRQQFFQDTDRAMELELGRQAYRAYQHKLAPDTGGAVSSTSSIAPVCSLREGEWTTNHLGQQCGSPCMFSYSDDHFSLIPGTCVREQALYKGAMVEAWFRFNQDIIGTFKNGNSGQGGKITLTTFGDSNPHLPKVAPCGGNAADIFLTTKQLHDAVVQSQATGIDIRNGCQAGSQPACLINGVQAKLQLMWQKFLVCEIHAKTAQVFAQDYDSADVMRLLFTRGDGGYGTDLSDGDNKDIRRTWNAKAYITIPMTTDDGDLDTEWDSDRTEATANRYDANALNGWIFSAGRWVPYDYEEGDNSGSSAWVANLAKVYSFLFPAANRRIQNQVQGTDDSCANGTGVVCAAIKKYKQSQHANAGDSAKPKRPLTGASPVFALAALAGSTRVRRRRRATILPLLFLTCLFGGWGTDENANMREDAHDMHCGAPALPCEHICAYGCHQNLPPAGMADANCPSDGNINDGSGNAAPLGPSAGLDIKAFQDITHGNAPVVNVQSSPNPTAHVQGQPNTGNNGVGGGAATAGLLERGPEGSPFGGPTGELPKTALVTPSVTGGGGGATTNAPTPAGFAGPQEGNPNGTADVNVASGNYESMRVPGSVSFAQGNAGAGMVPGHAKFGLGSGSDGVTAGGSAAANNLDAYLARVGPSSLFEIVNRRYDRWGRELEGVK